MMAYKMTYKKKAAVLSALIIFLALVYIISFAFDARQQSRDTFAWLDSASLNLTDSIEIDGSGGKTVLSRRNNIWVFSTGASGTVDYPVKQGRVDDLLSQLSRRDVYMLRSVSSEGSSKLGFAEGKASRIIVRGGAGLPLLDLLIGTGAVGHDVYLKRADKNEIYSGEDHVTVYTEGRPNSWYDLRLFPPASSSGMAIDNSFVQQAEIVLPPDNGTDAAHALPFTLSRRGDGWILAGNENAALDISRVEAWLRSVLEAEGGDFTNAPVSSEGSITLRFGDGTSRAIQAGPLNDDKSRNVSVSGSRLTYVLTEWTLNRIFKGSDYFLKGK